MSLTGLDPNSPIPGDYREFEIGAGTGASGPADRLVLLIGNRTTAGSETADTIDMTRPIEGETDAIARFGRRSEMYWKWRSYVAVDPDATVYAGCPAESGGNAATVDFVCATTATGVTTAEISFLGRKAYATINTGDTAAVVGASIRDAINAADEGTWPCTAALSTATVTVTMSQKGPRFGLCLGSTATVGMRIRLLQSVATTVTKGNFSAGTTEDDGTAVIAAAALGEFFYISSPWHSTSALTATDNQTGELLEMVKAQNLPANGKEMTVTCALVGTQAQAVTVCTSSPANTIQGHGIWQENSDWMPGMLAAHWTAVRRSQEIAYPAANLNGYRSADGQVFQVPTAYQMADRPSQTEIKACLNNGVTPVSYTPSGVPFVVRHITMRSLNAQGASDFKAREGHTYSVDAFGWQTWRNRWQSLKQPNVADDPVKGAKPVPLVSTPIDIVACGRSVILDLSGPNPLGGQYPGPIFDPSPAAVAEMLASVKYLKGVGSLLGGAKFLAVQHLIKTESKFAQADPAY